MVIRSAAVRHAARAGFGVADGGPAGAEDTGAGDAGVGTLDGEVADGWVPAGESLALGAGGLAGWADPPGPQAAPSEGASTAPANHPTRRAQPREDLDMTCSFRPPVTLIAAVSGRGEQARIREVP